MVAGYHLLIDEEDNTEGSPVDPDAVAAVLRSRLAQAGTMTMPVTGSSMGRMISSGSTVTVEASSVPKPGEVWAMVDDGGRIIVHLVRHVSDSHVVGRGQANEIDDQPVDKGRLVGRVTSAIGVSGSETTFGKRSRFAQRIILLARHRVRQVIRRLG